MMHAAPHTDRYLTTRDRAKRRHRSRRVARALLVCGLELSVAVALVLVISNRASAPAGTATPPPLTTEAVAASPAAYRSREIHVRGRVADWPDRIKRRDEGTFVIEGTRGARLLVVPAGKQRLRAFTIGTTVRVSGSVVIPPDSERLARRPTSRTAIAKRADAPALIKATRVDYVR
jgi:hypothetical protein